ncbi:MAG: hypothetical protein AAB790_00835 [Patescibacteria group bacterium]
MTMKIKHPKYLGRLEAILICLGGDDGADKLLAHELVLVDPKKVKKGTKAPDPLFAFVGRLKTEGTKEFVAKKNYVVDTSETTRVRISYLGNNFKKYLLPLVEHDIAPSDLVLSGLIRGQHDLPLDDENPGTIAGLGGTSKAVTGLYEFFETLAYKQAMGDLTPTVGYVLFKDEDGNSVLWPVRGHWHVGGWYVEAYSVSSPREWYAGYEFVSREP